MSTTHPSATLLYEGEEWWQIRYDWFRESGYRLRRRYSPDWVPSWQGKKVLKDECEDGPSLLYANVGDAIRLLDGAFVSLKVIHKSISPDEASIASFFSSEPQCSDPDNHCVSVWDILQDPYNEDDLILLMPLLREFDDPRFDTVGEVVEFVSQIFEGLRYMHQRRVAHRDVMGQNVMMDASPLYPTPYHPVRTEMRRDWKGKAKSFTGTQKLDVNALDLPVFGGDRTAPEFQRPNELQNPFRTDVYCLGNIIRRYFLSAASGFDFITPLVANMVHEDPERRPTMDEVCERWSVIRASLSSWTLRSRIVLRADWSAFNIMRAVPHWCRRISFVVRRVSPVPALNPTSA